MRLMRYEYKIVHVPGKELYTADALSRAPLTSTTADDTYFQQEVKIYANFVMTSLPASDQKLDFIRSHQEVDEVCRQLRMYVEEVWPEKHRLHGALQLFWPYCADMTIVDGFLMFGPRIFILSSLRLQMLDRIHEGHQGIQKCRARAQESIWWPGISQQIYDLVKSCRVCAEIKGNSHPEPLIPKEMPLYPWQKVATDLFEYQQTKLNTCSLWIISQGISKVLKLNTTTSSEIIHQMKRIFARHGIPQTVISDSNGPQYSSQEFHCFAASYGFSHITSSPGHPSGNGEAECAVRTVKQLLKGAKDPYLALLSYRSSPIKNGYSSAELLMGRKLRTTVPMIPAKPASKTPNMEAVQQFEQESRQKLKANFDKILRDVPPSSCLSLREGDEMYVPDRNETATVIEKSTPTSYKVQGDTKEVCRNRVQSTKM